MHPRYGRCKTTKWHKPRASAVHAPEPLFFIDFLDCRVFVTALLLPGVHAVSRGHDHEHRARVVHKPAASCTTSLDRRSPPRVRGFPVRHQLDEVSLPARIRTERRRHVDNGLHALRHVPVLILCLRYPAAPSTGPSSASSKASASSCCGVMGAAFDAAPLPRATRLLGSVEGRGWERG